jgi:hypothetical protein
MLDREIILPLKSDIGVGASRLMGNLVQVGVAIITTASGAAAWVSNQAHPLSPEGLVGVMAELREVRNLMNVQWPEVCSAIDWLQIDGSHNQGEPTQEDNDV